MLEDPGLDLERLAAGVRTGWAVEALSFTFIAGYDMRSAAYEVRTANASTFLKVHLGGVAEAPLDVPRALLDDGVAGILAPIRTRAGPLSHRTADGRNLVLYPFVEGRAATSVSMTADQWRTFGATMRAVHDTGLPARFTGRLPSETFGLPSAASVRRALDLAAGLTTPSPAQERLRLVLLERAARIGEMIDRARELGGRLALRRFDHVLCHGDIHAANILVADDGRILLVDWDGPTLAPRERDLLFVIGSRIARDVRPHEEDWFFDGYGDVPVDPEAIVYYRYERILEDLGEVGRSVFGDESTSETSRAAEVDIAEGFFARGGILETVEQVAPRWSPGPSP